MSMCHFLDGEHHILDSKELFNMTQVIQWRI